MRLMRWKQVDFASEAIKVGHSKTDHGAGRAVPLNKRAIDAADGMGEAVSGSKAKSLRVPRQRRSASRAMTKSLKCRHGPTPIMWWKTPRGTAKTSSGVEGRFRDLRHTVVTRLLQAGQPFAVVADIMGWSEATAIRMARRTATSDHQPNATRWQR